MDIKRDKRIISEIVSKYIELLRKNRIGFHDIYLFGSYVKGSYNSDSDIDLAIVLNKNKIDRFDERLKLMKLRWNVDLRIEPHPFSIKDFDKTDPFVKEIIATGEKIV
ncbi:MAG: nucleotidyltransferase domain-containing protein [Candidatus Desantisbacteria bacterium]